MATRAVLKAQRASATATILAAVTVIAGLVVGLGVISPDQQGIIVAITTATIAVAGLISHAIHTGSIEPSALVVGVSAVIAQAVALLVSFAWISEVTAGTVIAVSSAVVIAAAQIAHALLSRQLP